MKSANVIASKRAKIYIQKFKKISCHNSNLCVLIKMIEFVSIKLFEFKFLDIIHGSKFIIYNCKLSKDKFSLIIYIYIV